MIRYHDDGDWIGVDDQGECGEIECDLWFESDEHVDVLHGEATPQAFNTRWGRFGILGKRYLCLPS